jgi:hypothetical protein
LWETRGVEPTAYPPTVGELILVSIFLICGHIGKQPDIYDTEMKYLATMAHMIDRMQINIISGSYVRMTIVAYSVDLDQKVVNIDISKHITIS